MKRLTFPLRRETAHVPFEGWGATAPHLCLDLCLGQIVRYLESARTDAQLQIYMEYADGGTLEKTIRSSAKLLTPFTSLRVMRWVAQLAAALEHVHAKKVVHRDIKSENVFLTADGDVKLGDFGVARALSTHTHLAQTQVGTPQYAPSSLPKPRSRAFHPRPFICAPARLAGRRSSCQ